MNRNILNQAFITMGYRQMTDNNLGNVYGKPIGFGLIIAKINQNHKEVEFKTLLRRYSDGQIITWNSKIMDIDYTDLKTENEPEGNELYELYCKDIAYTEYEANADKIMVPTGSKYDMTFAFRAKNDIMSIFNL